MYTAVLHFPDESEIHMHNCQAQFHIGETILFEGGSRQYRIAEVQHQLRMFEGDKTPEYIMANVILEAETDTVEE